LSTEHDTTICLTRKQLSQLGCEERRRLVEAECTLSAGIHKSERAGLDPLPSVREHWDQVQVRVRHEESCHHCRKALEAA
jgi:hypothetical protein